MGEENEAGKIPRENLRPVAGTRTVGQKLYVSHDAMRVDLDRNGWIDPTAKREEVHLPSKLILIERLEGGFRVDLSRAGDPFTPGTKPEPRGDYPWIPVIEVGKVELPAKPPQEATEPPKG